MIITKLKLFLLGCSSVLVISACGQPASVSNQTSNRSNSSPAAVTTVAPQDSPRASTDGRELYSSKCTICHKDTGKGGNVTLEGKNLHPADLTSAKMKSRPDDKLAEMISEGDPDEGMPSFKTKLSPEQITAVVHYIRTLQQ
jgi:mono/diheme cytochrome c family protein